MASKDPLEDDVADVFRTLLNLRNEGIVVSKNAIIRGRSGADHEIDVYYEFTRASIRHKVAIECKNQQRPIQKSDVHDFWKKLDDIGGGIRGIIVSASGVQEGAAIVAKYEDIQIISPGDLPSIGARLAAKLEAVALPDESSIGEPFWTLMDVRERKVTGSYLAMHTENGQSGIPLFFSKAKARAYQREHNVANCVVRGLPQYSLRALLIMAYWRNWLLLETHKDPTNGRWFGIPYTARQVQDEYYADPNEDLDVVSGKAKSA